MKTVASLMTGFLLFTFCALSFAVEKPCEFCHVGHRGSGVLLNNDIDALCSGCHMERLAAGEHKTGMSPSMAVIDLPLYSGKVACATCHDPHAKTVGMLRKPASELCLYCHVK